MINSHLHFDHVGGNQDLPNAKLVVQRLEWEAAANPELIEKNGYNRKDFDLGHKLQLADGEHDLFGDGSVTLIPSYGHTAGHQSLRVRLDSGEVVMTADSCYMRKALEEMVLPPVRAQLRCDARGHHALPRDGARRRAFDLRPRRRAVEREGRRTTTATVSGAAMNIDYDPFFSAHSEDPYPIYAELRRSAPVYRAERSKTWVISRYDDVMSVLKDTTRFSSDAMATVLVGSTPRRSS